MTGLALLPSNATAWETAVSLTSAARRPIDSDIIRRVWSPWECPADLLPYLAHAFSVDLWDETWPETRKRSIIANAVEMHRLKGTLAGIEWYLSYVDVTVRKAVTPPAKVFSGPSLTIEQREAWLSRLPQVRVWRQFERSTRSYRLFCGGSRFKSFFDTGFPQPNDAVLRTARRARWIVDGVETDTRVVTIGVYFQLYIKAVRPYSVFSNRPFGLRRHFVPSTAASRIVTIEPVSVSPWRTPAAPSLQPVTSEPELVAQPGTRGRAVYDGPIGRSFFLPSTAGARMFERYAVNDGSQIAKRPSIQFMGVGRYGIRAYTAELSITMRGLRSRYAAGEGVFIPRRRFWLPHDSEPLNKVRRAAVAAKRRSETIFLDTVTPSGFVAGQILLAGDTFLA